ncbi:hypothetical protein K440DRAFT_646471 [Wilcoxina mikolae CBS 423.85]|nr:hypothetical protein K440DRAFT_646471 [Wilcoxina mikolae CBS 423.85]
MPPKPPLDQTQLKLLRDDRDLLHLLFHRNKNQHRLLKWWQWISTLRRNLNKLLYEHDLITSAKTTPNRNGAVAMYMQRLGFIRKVVVPSAHTAFGNVIAMKNFAPLGMVLMAVLARVWKVVKPTEEEMERERELAAVAAKLEGKGDVDAELGVVVPRGDGGEEGVVISRDEYEEGRVSIQTGAEESRMHRVEDRGGKASPRDALQPSEKKIDTGSTKPKRQTPHTTEPVMANTESIKQTQKERIGTPQADPESTSKKSKRKPDTEPQKRKKKKKKKKKGDDIDDLFIPRLRPPSSSSHRLPIAVTAMSTFAQLPENDPAPTSIEPTAIPSVPPAPTVVGATSRDNNLGPRMRQVFHYSDLDSDPKSDYHDAILYMDEQSQDQLIIDLQREDLDRNQFYCKWLWILTATPSPYFVIRYILSPWGGWIFNSDLFALVSLFISFRTVPAPTLIPKKNSPPIHGPDEWWRKAQMLNIVGSTVLYLWTWMKVYSGDIEERTTSVDAHLFAVPLCEFLTNPGGRNELTCGVIVMAVMGWFMRKMMEAVNFGELEHLRYQYKGA